MNAAPHDGLYLIDILSGIRSMRCLTEQDCLDIVNALHGRFPLSEDEGTPLALYECSRSIENEIEAQKRQDPTPDSWQQRQDAACNLATQFLNQPNESTI